MRTEVLMLVTLVVVLLVGAAMAGSYLMMRSARDDALAARQAEAALVTQRRIEQALVQAQRSEVVTVVEGVDPNTGERFSAPVNSPELRATNLLFVVRSGSEQERLEALMGLLDEEFEAPDGLVPALIGVLEDGSPLARSLASLVLGRHPEGAAPAVTALAGGLDDAAIRDAALYALERIARTAPSARRIIDALLDHEEEALRARAREILVRLDER